MSSQGKTPDKKLSTCVHPGRTKNLKTFELDCNVTLCYLVGFLFSIHVNDWPNVHSVMSGPHSYSNYDGFISM